MNLSTFRRLRAVAAKSPITLVCQVSARSAGALFVLAVTMLVAGIDIPGGFAQAVTYAGSGAVNFGSANVCAAGKTAPAPCSQTLTLTYDVTASGTLGTPLALTTGAAGLDYQLASGSTCSGSVIEGNTCKVNVTFAPIAPGARNGAVEIVDSSGNALATTYIYGTGDGPALAFNSGAFSAFTQLGSGLDAIGLAVDASGNLFVADSSNDVVREIPRAGGYSTIDTLGSGFDQPYGVAVDGAGNVFVADTYHNAVKEILRTGGPVKTLASGFSYPTGVAVDGSGNLFVADNNNDAVKELAEAGGYATVKTVGSGFRSPYGVAVDGSGNVYVADEFNSAVKEITAASGYSTVKTLGSGFEYPTGVAVDASGNVYVADNEGAKEILAAGGYSTVNTLRSTTTSFYGVAVDATGNVFASGGYSTAVTELPRSQPPAFAFGSQIVGTASSPLTAILQNIGNANLVGTSLSISADWEQAAGGGTPADCAASFTLAPSGECDLSIVFKPTELGGATGAATIVDNSLNAAGSTQSIALTGTGALAPSITGLSSTYGAIGSAVALTGTYFGGSQGLSVVSFNGVHAAVESWSNTEIVATVPASATTGNIVVTVDGEASNGVAFTVLPIPSITGISPSYGPVGTVVTISGQNLLDFGNKATATYNGTAVPVVSDSATAVKVVQSAGPVSGVFQLVVNNTILTSPTFTYAVDAGYAGTPVNFGSVNVCASGKTSPAPCSKTLALTFSIPTAATLGTPKALTYGAPNLDYKVASGSTCSGSVVKGNTCKVNVTFVATQPGARNGAVEIVDSSGNTLVTTYVYGTGAAPKIGFSAPATRSIGSGSEFFGPAAVDGSGNIFVSAATPPGGPVVVEELLAVNGSVPSNPAVRVLADNFSTSSGPQAFAIDGAGNVFFTVTTSPQQGTGYVEELLAADSYATMINLPSPDGVDPDGIAVDGSGNVFVSSAYFYNDYYSLGTIYELSAADGYTTATTLASSSDAIPSAIALDTVGNLFVVNYNSQNVLEYSPSDGYSTARTINAEYRGADGYTGPYSIAVDPAGDLFGALSLPDQEPNSAVVEYYAVDGALPANPTSRILEPDVAGGLSFDSRGNLYATQGPNGLEEVELSTPSAFSFDQTQVGHTSYDSPKSMLVQNQGNAALDLTGLSLDSSNWELVKGSGTPEDCSASTTLAWSALCQVSISFEPKAAGSLTGAATLTDNSLNASGSSQSLGLSGTAVGGSTAPHITSLNTNYAGHDAVVIIDGTNFGATRGSSKVKFNGIATLNYYWGSTQIYVTVPYDATSGNLVVTVEGQASNAIPFTVLPEPEVTGISPTSGPAGTVVTISGTDLMDYENKGTVTFDGKSLPILSDTSTAIRVAIPVGGATGYFHVLINDTGMNTSTFTVTK